MSTSTVSRPRLSAGVVVLLVLVTVANVLGLVLVVEAWVDWGRHGGFLGEVILNPASVGTVLSVVALVGVGGAWARRKWGPRLYFAAQAIGFVLVLVLGLAGPVAFVPLVLAGLLWWIGERDW